MHANNRNRDGEDDLEDEEEEGGEHDKGINEDINGKITKLDLTAPVIDFLNTRPGININSGLL